MRPSCSGIRRGARRIGMATAVIAVAGLAACVSTDATSDIERSQQLLAERAGLAADWLSPIEAAAAWDMAVPLSADTAVAAAIARSPELRAQVEEVARSRAELVQAGLLPNPIVSLSLGFPIAGADGGTSIGASLVQNLATVFSIGRRKDAATADLEQAVLMLSDQAVAIAAETRTLHARIEFADRAATYAEESAALLGRSLEITRRRMDAGEASRLDLNRVQVLHLQAEVEASQLRADSDAARRELLVRIGQPEADAGFGVEAGGAEDAEIPPEAVIIAAAASQRLDVAAAMAGARAAAERAGIADRSRLTMVDAGAHYEREDNGRDMLGPAVAISIPIFDTGDAAVAVAMAEARAAEHLAERARQAAIGQARVAWVRAKADAEAAARFETDIVRLADDNLGLAQRAYDAGEEDLTVLLETQRSRLATKLDLLRLRERAVKSRIELARAVGGSFPVRIAE